jgi:hypothetical protein
VITVAFFVRRFCACCACCAPAPDFARSLRPTLLLRASAGVDSAGSATRALACRLPGLLACERCWLGCVFRPSPQSCKRSAAASASAYCDAGNTYCACARHPHADRAPPRQPFSPPTAAAKLGVDDNRRAGSMHRPHHRRQHGKEDYQRPSSERWRHRRCVCCLIVDLTRLMHAAAMAHLRTCLRSYARLFMSSVDRLWISCPGAPFLRHALLAARFFGSDLVPGFLQCAWVPNTLSCCAVLCARF